MTNSEAIHILCELGARFILCRKPGEMYNGKLVEKNPHIQAMGGSGWFDREPFPPEKVIEHLEAGHHVGIEPCSLEACVVDCDGVHPRKDPDAVRKNKALAVQVGALLGDSGTLGVYPSASYAIKGSQHIWAFRDLESVAESDRNPTQMRLLGDREKLVDYRWHRAYVVVTPYLPALAGNRQAADTTGRPTWDVLERALRARDGAARPLPARTAPGTGGASVPADRAPIPISRLKAPGQEGGGCHRSRSGRQNALPFPRP